MDINHGEYQKLVDEVKDFLLTEAEKNLTDEQLKTVKLAFKVADQAHFGQFRKSGEPYITHPIEVATIITHWGLDEKTIAGALMHDVIEDTEVTKDDLAHIFGEKIADLVDGVTKLDKINFDSEEAAHAEYFRKVVLAMAKDLRVILIKLADRTHNMRTLGSMKPHKRKKISNETMEIYVPIAYKLGLHRVYTELAEESFKNLYPLRYRMLSTAIETSRNKQREFHESILKNITSHLHNSNIDAEVLAKYKSVYATYQRMQKSQQNFDHISEQFEVVVVVNTIGDCYLTTGVVHNLYKPIPGKFKDFIAAPKANGYQSLHSILISPQGNPIQVQIRTKEMNEVALHGIIKQLINQSLTNDTGHKALSSDAWIDNVLDIQSSTFSATEFLENIKQDLTPKNIYAFTPKGNIIHLPAGATPLDFAYLIHTEVGNKFRKAKVNQRYVAIDFKLHSGDVVEILTGDSEMVQEEWLNYVNSGRATSKIKQYLKEQKYDENISNGIRLLNLGLSMVESDIAINDSILKEIIEQGKYNFPIDEFEQKLGIGDIGVLRVIKQLNNQDLNQAISIKLSNCSSKPLNNNCCYPVADEEVLARITPQGQLELHVDGCRKCNAIGYNKFTKAIIINNTEHKFWAHILVLINNSAGVLAKIAGIVAKHNINMERIMQEIGDDHVAVDLILSLNNYHELSALTQELSELEAVNEVIRK